MSETTSKPRRFQIDFEPIGRRIEVEQGSSLLNAAQMAGVDLVSICGGIGICNSCKIRLIEGECSSPTSEERDMLSENELLAGFRLACQTIPESNVKIDIPSESLSTPQRLQIEGRMAETALDPAVVACDVHLSPPSLEDLRSDLSRLKQSIVDQIANPRIGIEMAKALPARLREFGWQARVALRGSEVVGVLPLETRLMGLAIDVGTTKLASYLVDLESGVTVAKAGAMNPQIAYGEDVISRISYANTQQAGRETLQVRLIGALNELIDTLCQEAEVERDQILEAVVVGNTAMHHFFSGLPVRQLGEAPYVPVVSDSLEIPATNLGLRLSPGAWVYLPPNIAGYVGADHMALLIATRLYEKDQIIMAVDIGTNTEISLAGNGRLLSCSCASGPAFEGAHIRDGMRAASGAIERMQFIDGEVRLQTIGGTPPVGICGSGILDAVAGMLNEGLLDRRGALQGKHPRIQPMDGKRAFVLSPAAENEHDQDIVVTREDVNEIQLAKGAIRAGMDILLKEADLNAADLEAIIIAGAFGTYIDIESAIRVGMFPELPVDRYQQIGNAAGAGAKNLLISKALRRVAEEIMGQVEYIELTTRTDFQKVFMERLYFKQN